MKKRLAAWAAVLLATLLLAAGAAQASTGATLRLTSLLDPSQSVDASYDLGALYAGGGASAGASAGAASAGATYWWYYDTTYYRMLVPGTSSGPNASYLMWAYLIDDYLSAAYSSARAVLGADNGGYGLINTWLYYDSANRDLLGYYTYGGNDIHLNLAASNQSAADYGATMAHETAHVLFDHKTHLYDRDPVAEAWLTEALAYYVGDTVYPYGYNAGYSYNSAVLKYYSDNGAQKSSWYESGARYDSRGGYSGATALDQAQVETIGYFLANYSSEGWGAIQDMVNYLAQGQSIDSALTNAYGLASGQMGTDSGEGVNTLYSKYIYYYLGHY